MSTASRSEPLDPYDALLLISFGGPEEPAEVQPFLEHVTAGRVPAERLAEVAEHYLHFGGRSPINDQCRALLAALRSELDARGSSLPMYWGNRHSEPWLSETVQRIAADGHRRVLALTTSAYPSYSSCRSYREEIFDAAVPGVRIDRIRQYAHHPGFAAANLDAVRAALAACTTSPSALLFVTHSIPTPMAEASGPPPRTDRGAYVDWHLALAEEICYRLREQTGAQHRAELAYCSRSGRPQDPWLEPDVNDRLRELAAAGVRSVVLAPIGFISDHMEVVFDLDTEARETAEELGLEMHRAATVGTHPAFVAGLVDAMQERAGAARGEPVSPAVINSGSPGLVECHPDCCANPYRPGRPAACQAAR